MSAYKALETESFFVLRAIRIFLSVTTKQQDTRKKGTCFCDRPVAGAVGSTATLVTMFTGFPHWSGGINVLTALYYGAKDKDSLSKTIHSAALVSLIMGVLLLVLGVGLSEWMLTMLKTREELLDCTPDLLSQNAGAGHLQLW